jgi:hypothetical protein
MMPKRGNAHVHVTIVDGEVRVAQVDVFQPGGYRFIRGVFQYSGGVAAQPGFAVERARFSRPIPLVEGFAAVERHLESIGRPMTSFCACELRSPAPFTDQGFLEFNQQYVRTLERWGIYKDGVTPVARTNVCPEFDKPAEPSLHAFSYTVPDGRERGSFIIAGGGEVREQAGNFRDNIERFRDLSPDGLRAKVRFVMAEMESRLRALGFNWPDAISTQAYTVHDIGPYVAEEFVKLGVTGGLTWHFCRPPVVDIEFEMDVRGAARENVL